MKRVIVLGAILAGPAFADETVQTTDGRKLLLRDNGTYEVLPVPKLACGEPERYREIDRHNSNLRSELRRLAAQKQKLCIVVDLRLNRAGNDKAQFSYADTTSNAGEVNVTALPQATRSYLDENCVRTSCRAVVYGLMLDRKSVV